MLTGYTKKDKKLAKYVGLPIAVFSVSTAAILIRFSNSNPITIAFYRMFFSSLFFLFPFLKNKGIRTENKKNLLLIISSGIFLALHFAFWIASLNKTTVASSVVLVSSHPLLVMFFSSKFLGEEINQKAYYSVLFALLGVFLIALGDYSVKNWNVIGDIYALIGMFFLGFYILIGKVVRKDISTSSYVFSVYSVASIVLGFVSFFIGTSFKIYPIKEYLIFFLLALIPTLFGHSIYNWALRYVKADLVSITLLGEPIISSVLALIILSESPPTISLIGVSLTIIGIYLSLKLR